GGEGREEGTVAKPESGRIEAAHGARSGSGRGRRASDEAAAEPEALEPSRRQLGEAGAASSTEPAVGARLNADGVLEPAARTRFSYDASERASDEAETNGGPASAEEEPDSSAPTVASNSARAAMMFEALQAQPDEDAAEQAPPPRAS